MRGGFHLRIGVQYDQYEFQFPSRVDPLRLVWLAEVRLKKLGVLGGEGIVAA